MPAEASAKAGLRAQVEGKKEELKVTRLKLKTGILLTTVFIPLFAVMWFVLDRLTDSPVPVRDSFITSLSIIATWMLARKIYEHWYLWIVVNATASFLFFTRGLYPTVILYIVYGIMSFAGLKSMEENNHKNEPHPHRAVEKVLCELRVANEYAKMQGF